MVAGSRSRIWYSHVLNGFCSAGIIAGPGCRFASGEQIWFHIYRRMMKATSREGLSGVRLAKGELLLI